MSRKKYTVDLSDEERAELEEFVTKGTHRAEDITRARILLKADDGLTDAAICEHVGCSVGTPHRARKAYTERGLRRFIAASPIETTSRNSTAEPKPISSPLPVLTHRKAGLAGPMPCSLTAWLPSRRSSSTRSPRKLSDSV
ncbi:helix-turn-helix domain-containing protein [Natrialba swarupiae]|nr:helix-turn-helix domain-containing protein [Natrialba swarupiae]